MFTTMVSPISRFRLYGAPTEIELTVIAARPAVLSAKLGVNVYVPLVMVCLMV
jgi:hypothetical protein